MAIEYTNTVVHERHYLFLLILVWLDKWARYIRSLFFGKVNHDLSKRWYLELISHVKCEEPYLVDND